MRLRRMLYKELLQFRRNKIMLRMAILVPLLQTFLLSCAVNRDVFGVPLAVCDEDGTQRSRAVVEAIGATRTFKLSARRLRPWELERDLDRGAAELTLHIPSGFARDLDRQTATVQVLADGTDPVTAGAAAAYLQASLMAYGAAVQANTAARMGRQVRLPSVEPQPRVFYNPDLRTLWFMGPAVLAMVLTVLMQNFTALSIARERELGTLEQLVMTPIRAAELLLGKLIPFFVVGCLDAALVGALVVYVLGVPFRGSILVLAAATIPFLFAVLGLGLLVSTVCANQQQAQLTNFFLIFPSILLSGFIFPVENMPLVLQWLSKLIPMTYYLQVIRGTFLRGSGFAALWPEIIALMLLAALFFSAGAVRFRKRLD